MSEKFVTREQKIEFEHSLVADVPRKKVYQHELEASLTETQKAARRQMITERQRYFSSVFITWKYPHYHEMKHLAADEVGEEIIPLPSLRADGQITDRIYRRWWGTRWVPVAQTEKGDHIEAQVRRYDEEHEGIPIICGGVYNRKNPEMAICTRIANYETGMASSASEVFRFARMPMNNGEGGDIQYRGDSIALDPEHWSDLDELLLALGAQFDASKQAEVLANAARLAIET